MPNFYGGGNPYGSTAVAPITPTFGSGDGDSELPKPEDTTPGKTTLDMADVIGSIGEGVGSLVGFGQGLVGGAAGAIGSIGVPGGPNLGDVGELPGGLVDAIGSIGFGDGKNIGALPGAAVDVISAPGRFAETEFGAKYRLRHTASGGGADFTPESGKQLPPDIAIRLANGESIDKLADEMVARGEGWNSDAAKNLAAGVILDPMNLIAPGVGKAAGAAKGAGLAVEGLKAAESIGVSERFIGTAYNAASRGLRAGGARLMDEMIGPATSGVFHAIGSKPYQALRSGLAELAPDYAGAFERAMAVGAAQMPRAVVAREIASDIALHIRRKGQAVLDGLDDLGPSIESRLSTIRRLNPAEIERSSEELLLRVAPDFTGRAADDIASETARKLAATAGTSVEDAARVLGKRASDLKTAQTVHLAFYGKVADDFGAARAAVATAKNIDVERLSLVAPDTLTVERAAQILDGSPDNLIEAVERYSVLANRFSGTQFDHAAVKAFVEKLRTEGALVDAVKLPRSGRNALPKALGAWRARYADFGYDLGFSPRGGLKTIIDPDTGDVIYAEPFVQVVTEADPLTMRNPLGRFMDSLFRGTTQSSIILDSRARFVKFTRAAGISPNEARGLHKVVIEEARKAGTSPRGLDPEQYAEMFERYLGPTRYAEFAERMDPTFAVMKAFEGNLSRVGATQWLTGKAKTGLSEKGNIAAAIAERLYPTIRFKLNPLFQLQELVESPFWNALRGVRVKAASEDIAGLYDELATLPEVRHFTEAGYFLHIWGNEAVARQFGPSTVLGKALSRLPNIAEAKRGAQAAQIASEHPEAFEKAVTALNPKYWRAMAEAYGTTDAREIAHRFLTEAICPSTRRHGRGTSPKTTRPESPSILSGSSPARLATCSRTPLAPIGRSTWPRARWAI